MFRTLRFPYNVTSASLARRYVEQFAAEEMVDYPTAALAATVATELVTNAVLHGAQPVELTLRREGDEVTIEVADGDPAVAKVRTPAARERTLGGRDSCSLRHSPTIGAPNCPKPARRSGRR